MDTTPRYIKMCEKAEEIQHHAQAVYCIVRDNGHKWQFPNNVFVGVEGRWWCEKDDKRIWLPRQDQLQEMVDNLQTTPNSMFKALVEWCNDPHGYGSIPFPKHIKELELWWEYIESFETSEQLWLAFVMKEKFNKAWDDKEEEWLKEQ